MTRTTPIFSMTPDYTPIVRMMAMQTRFAIETSQGFMKLAMLPWAGLPKGFGSICTPMGGVTVTATVAQVEPATAKATKPAKSKIAEPEMIEAKAVEVKDPAPKAKETAAPAPEAKAAEVPAPEAVKTAPPAPEAEKVSDAAAPAPKAEAVETPAMSKPKAIAAPARPDDLTALNGVGPKLAEALNAEGIYTYAQIAAWTDANVAWADENLPGVRGRASRSGWVAQAAGLAK